jgi:hypothetical protein
MRLINHSPYDTRVLRRCVVAAYREFAEANLRGAWWRMLQVHVVLAGTRNSIVLRRGREDRIILRVPKLTGHEWVYLTRQANGEGPPSDDDPHAPLRSVDVWHFAGAEFAEHLHSRFRMGVRALPGVPPLVPLRVARPVAPRDRVQERYARVLALEKTWTRKIKLAQTKVRAYKRKRQYYEKQMAARKDPAAGKERA